MKCNHIIYKMNRASLVVMKLFFAALELHQDQSKLHSYMACLALPIEIIALRVGHNMEGFSCYSFAHHYHLQMWLC